MRKILSLVLPGSTAAPSVSSAISPPTSPGFSISTRSEEHTSELQSQSNLVCRLLLEKKKHYQSSLLHCYLWMLSSSCLSLRGRISSGYCPTCVTYSSISHSTLSSPSWL